MIVAIDGPAGTGKSSVTKRLCDRLGFVHIDTGALYRAIAVLHLRDPLRDLGDLLKSLDLFFQRKPELNPSNRIFVKMKQSSIGDGSEVIVEEDLTRLIRTPEVTMAASRLSALPIVREALFGVQRKMGLSGQNVILEGRDIGTVVFPEAEMKFFLTASLDERAKRRWTELEASGDDIPSFDEIKLQIAKRDQDDQTRALAPLKQAKDAIVIDTSQLMLDEVVEIMAKSICGSSSNSSSSSSSGSSSP